MGVRFENDMNRYQFNMSKKMFVAYFKVVCRPTPTGGPEELTTLKISARIIDVPYNIHTGLLLKIN